LNNRLNRLAKLEKDVADEQAKKFDAMMRDVPDEIAIPFLERIIQTPPNATWDDILHGLPAHVDVLTHMLKGIGEMK